MQYSKYNLQKEQAKDYINKQLSLGFKENIDHIYCSGFRLIKMCPMMEEMGELWYTHIKECGIECQISFQFIEQLYSQYIIPLEYKETWNLFEE